MNTRQTQAWWEHIIRRRLLRPEVFDTELGGIMTNTLVLILAGGRGTRLSVLSQKRVKPAVPFAGKYRLIDFSLSNCANSGILDIGIPTQYRPHSLNNHIRTGRPWDLDRNLSGGVTLLPPCQRDTDSLDWYRGTADAVFQNLDFILGRKADTLLVLSGDHIYKMDYRPLIRYHEEHRSDVTICVTKVPWERASEFGIVVKQENGRVIDFQEKPWRPSGTLASMGIYVFRTQLLIERLFQDAANSNSTHDFGQDVLPRMLELGDRVYAYPFEGYWKDVGTVQAYWDANMDLLGPDRLLNLSDPRWSIHTRNEGRPPAVIYSRAVISNSLITDGCIIEGQVENSVLSPGVRVRASAVVRDSVIFSDCEIGPGAAVERAILDKNVVVGNAAYVGLGPDLAPNGFPSTEIEAGITLVGKNTSLPAGMCVDRGCVIGSDLEEKDFASSWTVTSRSDERQSFRDDPLSLPVPPTVQEGVATG